MDPVDFLAKQVVAERIVAELIIAVHIVVADLHVDFVEYLLLKLQVNFPLDFPVDF